MKRTYLNQFTINATRPLHVPDFLLKEAYWDDLSWGNDAMPHFTSPHFGIAVYVDYDNPEDREFDDMSRCKYYVYKVDAEDRAEDESLFEGNDEAELLTFITDYAVGLRLKELNDDIAELLNLVRMMPENHTKRVGTETHLNWLLVCVAKIIESRG